MSDAESMVEEAIGFLQKTSSATGGSLFDHLTDIVSTVRSSSSPCDRNPLGIQILKERPHDALDVLEASYILKRFQRKGEDASLPEHLVPRCRLRILPEIASLQGEDHVRRMETYLKLLRYTAMTSDAGCDAFVS